MTDDRHLPTHLDAGSLTLSRMTTEDLRAELKATLSVTARHLLHLANVWRELERRGEDLSGLRSGLWSYMGLIASEELRPEIVVRYAGYTMLLKRLTRLSLADQDRLIADDRVALVEMSSSGFEERAVSLSRLKATQINQVLRDRILSAAEQRQTLIGTRVEVAAPASRKLSDRVIVQAKARTQIKEKVRHTVAISLSNDEWDALKARADAAGLPMTALVTAALAAAGLLVRPKNDEESQS